ncbi:uncharacterized protein STEHIDRAFT_108244 [Stereum hirsutum FP-91666 SS1]|uniref:uncharacterized protein n=1 Tax=Stereum hirsutum (strain FP-91666) TaxID=721885 RepID=UPI000440D947|nr:uncharacterized protein STEHIDRAFT_108244 [Stereum hirsutum FP-91666 SS1]EIM89521.1 hypothetical protein STEHIDRAFT_108244 [Stereum hirsutum FP-91666 SS1]
MWWATNDSTTMEAVGIDVGQRSTTRRPRITSDALAVADMPIRDDSENHGDLLSYFRPTQSGEEVRGPINVPDLPECQCMRAHAAESYKAKTAGEGIRATGSGTRQSSCGCTKPPAWAQTQTICLAKSDQSVNAISTPTDVKATENDRTSATHGK